MEKIKIILEYFLVALAFGSAFFSFIAKPKMTGLGFLKLLYGVCASSTLLALITHLSLRPADHPLTYFYLAVTLIQCLPFLVKENWSGLEKFLRALYLGTNILYVYVISLFFQSFTTVLAIQATPMALPLMVVSMLFLGSITYGMILGHWYLVVPKLSERPLLTNMQINWALMAVKLILSAIGVWLGYDHLFPAANEMGGDMSSLYPGPDPAFSMDTTFLYLMLSMRFIWGYVILFILSIFTWKLIRIRSIQSATGVLYVMVFFLFVGEIIAAYLFINSGLLV